MTTLAPSPQDAALLAALEYQYRQISGFAARAERLCGAVPMPASTWQGTARRAYDTAVSSVVVALDEALSALRSAQQLTGSALDEVNCRA